MIQILAALVLIVVGIIVFNHLKSKPYDSFPVENDDVSYWRDLNN